MFCTLSCEDGFSFAYQSLDDYFCPYNNTPPSGYVDEPEYAEMDVTGKSEIMRLYWADKKTGDSYISHMTMH